MDEMHLDGVLGVPSFHLIGHLLIMGPTDAPPMPPSLTHPNFPSSRIVDALESWGFDVGPAARLSRTILDTFDGRLHAAGMRLELANVPQPALVLAGGSSTPVARLLWSTAPTWPADLPPGPFRSRLTAITRDRALLPVMTLTSSSRTARRCDRRGKTVVAVEIHEGLAIDGSELVAGPGWLAEVLSISGYADAAEDILIRLRGVGLESVDDDAVAVVARAAGRSLAGHDSSPTVPLSASDEALDAFRRVLRNLAATMEANIEGTIADTDPEFLHELRVAVRRTRSVLAEGKGVLPAEVRDHYRERFGWLGQMTGAPRDLDVYLIEWGTYVAPLGDRDATALEPLRSELTVRQAAAHRELAAALQSELAAELLTSWRRWLTDQTVPTEEPQHIGPFIAKRIEKAHKKVLRDGRSITPESAPERLHDLRKDAKRLRYLLECFGGLFDVKARKGFVKQLKALQENLGDHQDADVHLAQLEALAHDLHHRPDTDSGVLLAMGRLSEHLERRLRAEREEFSARFATYDTKANRRALTRLLRDAANA
jgi:CHAD domain-containing protein